MRFPGPAYMRTATGLFFFFLAEVYADLHAQVMSQTQSALMTPRQEPDVAPSV